MRSRVLLALVAAALLGAAFPARSFYHLPPPPGPCPETRAQRSAPAAGIARADVALRSGLRVFAMQYKQDIRHVETYETFAHKIDCMVREYVLPNLSAAVPNLVVFNEDIGLATLATGSRGAAAREFARSRLGKGGGDQSGFPVAAAQALALVNAGYAKEIAYYQARFPGVDPRKQVFLAATDTFARGYSQTFSDIARRYGLYVVASNNQAVFRESSDPGDVAALADPDVMPRPTTVYVATGPEVWNQTQLWGPVDRDPPLGPGPERNLLFRNKKVPLTDIEKDFIALDEGPATGPEAARNIGFAEIPDTGAKLGFATSFPAFKYGYPIGESLPAGVDPCADTAVYYMACMNEIGVNVVVQAEANPGRWAGIGGDLQWQPLEWMASTWRAVADPTVAFRYNVTPHMVGNLLDLVFDGQTAITSRDGGNPPRHYVGNTPEWATAEDDPEFFVYAGGKGEFLMLAPWLLDTDDRNVLRNIGARLAPGSGDPLENDYLETAVWADLVF